MELLQFTLQNLPGLAQNRKANRSSIGLKESALHCHIPSGESNPLPHQLKYLWVIGLMSWGQKNLKTGAWKKPAWFPKPKKWPGGCRFQSRFGTLCFVKFPLLMCGPGDHREHSMSAYPRVVPPTACSGVTFGQCLMKFLNLEEWNQSFEPEALAYWKEWLTGKKGLFETQITRTPGKKWNNNKKWPQESSHSLEFSHSLDGSETQASFPALLRWSTIISFSSLRAMARHDQTFCPRQIPAKVRTEQRPCFLMLYNHLNTKMTPSTSLS